MKLEKDTVKKILFIILAGIAFYMLLSNLDIAISWISKMVSIFMPVILGLCIAFLLNPIVCFADKRMFGWIARKFRKKGKNIARALSVATAYIVLFGIVALLAGVIIPDVREAFGVIGKSLPEMLDNLFTSIRKALADFDIAIPSFLEGQIDWVMLVQNVMEFLDLGEGNELMTGIIDTTISLVGGVFDFIMGIVVSAYVLLQKESIGRFFDRFTKAYFSSRMYNGTMRVAKISGTSFRNFVSGQLIEAVIIGMLTFVGMMIFRFPYPLATSAVIMFTALIPVFGAWIGGILGAVLALTASPLKALFFIVFIIVLQQLEGNLIYPKVVGKTIGLPGILVFLAVLLGGSMAGVVGMLFAVPICAIGYTLILQAMEARLKPKEAPKEAKSEKTKSKS